MIIDLRLSYHRFMARRHDAKTSEAYRIAFHPDLHLTATGQKALARMDRHRVMASRHQSRVRDLQRQKRRARH